MRAFVSMLAVVFAAACSHDHSHGTVDATPYIVGLREDVEVEAFLDEHYLEPTERLPLINGFTADLRPATVETLRADARVERLQIDHTVLAPGEGAHEH